MTLRKAAGTAGRLLCPPFAVALIVSCQPPATPKGPNDAREIEQLIEATKNNPSLQPGSNEAGPPIHVDPYPHSASMAHDHDSAHR